MKRIVHSSGRIDDTEGTGYSKDFEEIGAHASQVNTGIDVTGFLICTPLWFCQILEGKAAKVDKLFKKIKADERHFNVDVLHEEPIGACQFSAWGMAWKHQTIANRIVLLEHGLVAHVQPERSQLDHIFRAIALLSEVRMPTKSVA